MKTDPDALRRIVDQVLTDYKPDNPNRPTFDTIYGQILNKASAEQVECQPHVVIEHWWHLARIGVIAMTGYTKTGTVVATTDHQNFIVTERGRKLLAQGQDSPHDPPRYIDAIKRRVTTPDDIVLVYVNEAVGAWSTGLNRSSAVMLGCACERLIIMVAEVIATKTLPKSAKIKTKLADPKVTGISGLYEDVRETLADHVTTLPGDVKDQLDRKLSAIFDHARILRNKTGHPTGADVTAEDAQAGLLLFPGFYDLCVKIIQAL